MWITGEVLAGRWEEGDERHVTLDEVIDYWLGPVPKHPDELKPYSQRWYRVDAEVDAQVAERFGQAVEQARSGELLHWGEEAWGALALVILLDQFGRNVYRDSALAFVGDPLARAIAVRALDRGFDRQLSVPGRAFLYHPFEHSEDLADQARSVALFECLVEEVEPLWRDFAAGFVGYATAHRRVIERFGRFPHRNAALGRESSAEEREYLEAGGGF